jgi:hypothetical protein
MVVLSLILTLIFAQQSPAATPESYLAEATRLLASVADSANADTTKTIAPLRSDFDNLAGAYLSQKNRAAASGVAGAVGTSGMASVPSDSRAGGDWRAQYAAVERDFTSVLPQVDAETRRQLEAVHQNLQLFYTATLGETREANPIAHAAADSAAPTAAPPQTASVERTPGATNPDRATMLMLLERMEKLASDPLSTGKDGKVTINRVALDEILAEIAQIKAMLRRSGG